MALVASLSACGGDSGADAGSIATYDLAVQEVIASMTADTFAAVPAGSTPGREAISTVVEARRRAAEALEALSPPAEMEPEHLVLVEALRRLVSGGEAFLADTESLDPEAFVAALETSTEVDALARAVAAACSAWEDRSENLGIAVELAC
ncbi:MAG: hypothetical protein QY307_10250 [Acidimicrobiia bacterium]|nr:MAG: hypothetical protein QY307_10250 [Acidimicrobiia bacterium]